MHSQQSRGYSGALLADLVYIGTQSLGTKDNDVLDVLRLLDHSVQLVSLALRVFWKQGPQLYPFRPRKRWSWLSPSHPMRSAHSQWCHSTARGADRYFWLLRFMLEHICSSDSSQLELSRLTSRKLWLQLFLQKQIRTRSPSIIISETFPSSAFRGLPTILTIFWK